MRDARTALEKHMYRTLILASAALITTPVLAQSVDRFEYGPRPYYLIVQMQDGPLKQKLQSCSGQNGASSLFSIGHRGAPMQFPEHTVESNLAAARMGAGILECDVTFTNDLELVCRHAQNDLHTTTNILATPLASTCTVPLRKTLSDQIVDHPFQLIRRQSPVTWLRSLTNRCEM